MIDNDDDDVTGAPFGPQWLPWWALGAFLLVLVVVMCADGERCRGHKCPPGTYLVIARRECVCLEGHDPVQP